MRNWVRDGVSIHIEQKLPAYKRRQVFHLSNEGLSQLKQKIDKVCKRGYLEKGYVRSLINYFAVPKGEGDIRIVYDGTKCGLNQAVWSPNFYLPSVDSLLLNVSSKTWFGDMDLGEMFLNYILDEKNRPYTGVDVSKLNEDKNNYWLRWNRTLMGFRSSPYIACKSYGWTVDMARGNRLDEKNPFRWNSVRLNLPGSENYDPQIPWVSKMYNNEEAADVVVYVDDVRLYGSSESRCRAAGKRISKITQYLGEQDASRKFRPPSQEPGPWCGSFVAVKDGSVYAYVSQNKWDKAKAYVQRWAKTIELAVNLSKVGALKHKQLEQGRGFLVYLSRTYTTITPYLKGIHLTLDSWRDSRDTDGWKMKSNARRINDDLKTTIINSNEEGLFGSKTESDRKFKVPKFVKAVPRLLEDLRALNSFFKDDVPPWRFIRGRLLVKAKYGFGDASKSSFGSTFQTNDGISYRYGTWGSDGQSKSSNFRELQNLAQSIEKEVKNKNMIGAEVFICTDNSAAECAYYKVTSSSKQLFNIIYVAGTRMIAQGTDGLSRGDLLEGVMKNNNMLQFVPLHLSAFHRSKNLEGWFNKWISPSLQDNEVIESLDEIGWFRRGHDIISVFKNLDGVWTPKYKPGIFIWNPAPSAAQVAVEQLRDARNKRMYSLHIFVVPRLFTSIWRRQLSRVVDLFVTLPFIEDIWEKSSEHEPLTLAFVFPFLSSPPGQLKRSSTFLALDRHLYGMWKENSVATGFILCQLLIKTRSLASMPEFMVRKMLRTPSGFGFFHHETGK